MAILVAYDGSHPARKAVEHAIDEYPDEEIILLRVIEAAESSTGAGINLAKETVKSMLDEMESKDTTDLTDRFELDDIDFRIESTIGHPARQIVQFADDHDVDHIIVGNHGRDGLSRILLGSVAESVVRRSSVPVTVVR